MIRELLLIRHATTDLEGRLCGQLDPSLNLAGKVQLTRLVENLREMRVGRLYASDLKRASETALALAAVWNLPIISREDLREISFGDWEGRRWCEVREQTGGALLESWQSVCPPGGESFSQFHTRVLQALNEITHDPVEGTVAIVTHLGVIRVALTQLAKDRPGDSAAPIEYCGVYRFVSIGQKLLFAGRLECSQTPDPNETQSQEQG